MGCGCKERCKRWRASLKRWESRITSKMGRRMVRKLRESLLQCPED